MSLIEKFNSKLSYKLHLPIISVVVIGLSIILVNSSLSINQLKNEKHLEVQETYKYYAKKAIEKQSDIVLTNAIALADNIELIQSLNTNNREAAAKTLSHLTQQYEQYSQLKNVKIHLHTKDLHSFIRSWKLNRYGDDLSSFRHSLKYLGEIEEPFVTVEIGRAGILLRGIAPIYYQDEYIGSLEFIQSFDNILDELKTMHNLDALILSSEDQTIQFFNKLRPIGQNRVLLNSNNQTNDALIAALKDVDFDVFETLDHLVRDNFYITAVPLHDFNNVKIGCFLVVDSLSNVDAIINNAQQTLLYQVIMMLIIDALIILILAWILHRSITSPISCLSEQITNLNDVINDLDKLKEQATLTVDRKDELGAISRTFNSFIDHISRIFKELQKSNKINEEYLKAVYAGSIVSKGDLSGNITYVNDALCKATGYNAEELIGKPHRIFRHPSTPKSTFRNMWRTITKGNIWHGLFKNRRKDGSTFYANITVVPILDETGKTVEYLALRDDVTELVQSQKKLRKAFNTDTLTSLGNRFKLLDDFINLEEAYMAMIDVRSFKEINDFYGYELGDKVIKALADELFNCFDDPAYEVYRLHGDEFAVLVNGHELQKDAFISKINDLVHKMSDVTLNIDDYQLDIDLTIGLSTNRADLFTEADIAHKTAKKQNQTLVVYSEELQTSEEYKNNLLWTGRVKKALQDGRIISFYQPIINNQTMQVEKYESLVRMATEEEEIISPYFFLDIAKKARLYTKLTKTMIDNSFENFANKPEQFSINLTADDMVNDDLTDYLLSMIDQYKIGNRLVLEIVESESVQNFETVIEFLSLAKNKGCKIAVDDFGTGYSNFEFLLKLKPDYLKIDGSMIRNINTDPDTYNIVETIISFAQKNNIKTIAEFVSDEEIFNTIKEMGVDYSQGYYFGAPEPH